VEMPRDERAAPARRSSTLDGAAGAGGKMLVAGLSGEYSTAVPKLTRRLASGRASSAPKAAVESMGSNDAPERLRRLGGAGGSDLPAPGIETLGGRGKGEGVSRIADREAGVAVVRRGTKEILDGAYVLSPERAVSLRTRTPTTPDVFDGFVNVRPGLFALVLSLGFAAETTVEDEGVA
jgi:hypothetical protein